MTDFFMVFYSSPNWVFIALGGILLIIELLGTGGYGLWSGIAAIIVGLIAWILPLSWPILWILFAILTLVSAYLWWLWLKKHGKDKSSKGEINQPQQDLIGIKTVVTDAIINGSGRVKIKDGTWSARCDQDLNIGQHVIVEAVDGIILHVKPID
ncbi:MULTISPECIES: NfeD family protein [unclassified Gilliamella]|uniref:NfeD family protein n=1 Tax=unclassified Gilliamella TaxID=2685620 RepID=UPI00130C0F29|nr:MULTISPECIES: NfeD family protein [unclassified Gilliamella]MWP48453.1 NfeD family protein [Gilliamella sp. Lep-s35]MWP68268.1 NfeD family protein [Gilliamella sp. Lep-s5]MWP76593.1 NfeD family protein [Gilliamella sp. Lep-s21]